MIQYQKVYDSSKLVFEKLFFAIRNRDVQGLEYIIVKAKTPDIETLKYGSRLLIYAYDEEFLEAAHLLVKFGLYYNPITFLYSHPSIYNVTVYENHLTDLKIHLSGNVYIEAGKLLKAMLNSPIISYNISNCINYAAIIANHTYTDNLNNSYEIYNFISSIYSLNNQIVKDAFRVVALSEFTPNNSKVAIYLTITKHSERHPSYIVDIEANKERIYLPLEELTNYQAGTLVHEFKHTTIQMIFKNKANPYPVTDTNLQFEYHEAIKKSVISIFQLFDGYRYLKIIAKTTYATEDPLNLEYFNFIKASSHSPLMVFKYKSDWSNQKFINDAYSALAPYSNQDDDIENQFLWVQDLYNNFVKKYYLNEAQLEMLDRVAECITRPLEDVDSEMIVRVGELYAKGLNKTTLAPLEHIEKYELLVIMPEISKLENSLGIQECITPPIIYTELNVVGDSEVMVD